MVNKRMNKRGALSFTVIFISLILGFLIINAAFNFMIGGVETYDVEIPPAQNETFTTLIENQNKLNTSIGDIRESVDSITVESGAIQTFWNSFKGLGAILKLPITLIDVGVSSTTALILGTNIVPLWIQTLVIMLIVILIALAIVAAMTGGNSNI